MTFFFFFLHAILYMEFLMHSRSTGDIHEMHLLDIIHSFRTYTSSLRLTVKGDLSQKKYTKKRFPGYLLCNQLLHFQNEKKCLLWVIVSEQFFSILFKIGYIDEGYLCVWFFQSSLYKTCLYEKWEQEYNYYLHQSVSFDNWIIFQKRMNGIRSIFVIRASCWIFIRAG